jgi:maleamate amidohydrolase
VGSASPEQRAKKVGLPVDALHERGIGHTIGFGERPAVVVVDLINAFTDPNRPLGADLDAEIGQTLRVLDEARARKLPILFTAVAYDDPGLADAGVWVKKIPAQRTLRAGTPDVELDPRLGRLESEPLLQKKYASAFFGTDLLTRLEALRVDTLLLAGCTTSGCVRASAVDGLQHGFRVMVIREAVGDRLQVAHDQSLLDLHAKYADVVSVDKVLEYLRRVSVPGARGPRNVPQRPSRERTSA